MTQAVKQAEITQSDNGGYRMPAEWTEHERCWMAWPSRPVVWGDNYQKTKQAYVNVAHAIRRFEPVSMLVCPEDETEARSMLGADIDIVPMKIDDSWMRDTGPCFLLNDEGKLAGADLVFNSWGGDYHPYDSDAAIAGNILKKLGVPRVTTKLTGEGGGICVDGEGTILTTETCLLNTNRNPGWTKREVEEELKRVLGGEKVIWLPGNKAETETNGHVDGIAAFVKPGVVLFEINPDPFDPMSAIVQENLKALEGATDAKGRELDILFIEEAYDACVRGEKFCQSYINFYFANGGIVMPSYGIGADDRARAVFEKLFPEREIVQVRIDDVAIGGGGIHCITQQQPKART